VKPVAESLSLILSLYGYVTTSGFLAIKRLRTLLGEASPPQAGFMPLAAQGYKQK
jgi:hypothetical protein